MTSSCLLAFTNDVKERPNIYENYMTRYGIKIEKEKGNKKL